MARFVGMVILALVLLPVGRAQAAPASPSSASSAAKRSATAPDCSRVGRWLSRIENRARQLDTLRAEMRYERIQGLLGDRQIRFGTLWYAAGPPAKFAATFDRLVVGERVLPRERAYIFDGHWLAERIGRRQQFIRRELAPPEEEGERDLLELGEGPFALPLNFNKKKILRRFEVSLVPGNSSPREGKNAEKRLHLRLDPRPEMATKLTRIDLWYDRDRLLPVKVHAVNQEDQTETVVTLRRLQTREVAIPSNTFDTTPPDDPGWQVEIEKQH